MKKHTGKISHKCKRCAYKCSHLGNLKSHLLTHTGEKPHQCNICKNSFTHVSSLNKHLRIHTGEKPYKCKKCKKRFTQAGTLKQHILTHTGKNLHTCTICNKSVSNLIKHLLIHTGEKLNTCKICDKNFIRVADLKQHLLIHTGEKPHKCKICNYSCAQAGNLKKHILTHCGAKRHKAKISARSLAMSDDPKRYLKTHNGDKLHECYVKLIDILQFDVLNKNIQPDSHGFNINKSILQSSAKQANYSVNEITGEKPHKCKICNGSCAQAGNLKKNILTHCGAQISARSLPMSDHPKRYLKTHNRDILHECYVKLIDILQFDVLNKYIQPDSHDFNINKSILKLSGKQANISVNEIIIENSTFVEECDNIKLIQLYLDTKCNAITNGSPDVAPDYQMQELTNDELFLILSEDQ